MCHFFCLAPSADGGSSKAHPPRAVPANPASPAGFPVPLPESKVRPWLKHSFSGSGTPAAVLTPRQPPHSMRPLSPTAPDLPSSGRFPSAFPLIPHLFRSKSRLPSSGSNCHDSAIPAAPHRRFRPHSPQNFLSPPTPDPSDFQTWLLPSISQLNHNPHHYKA